MVRPASFGWNPQTGISNHFQPSQAPEPPTTRVRAQSASSMALVAALRAGRRRRCMRWPTSRAPACPDAVFPNNWVSLHADGTVVLYPMLAPNRRLERRLDLLQELERQGGFRVCGCST